MPLALHSNNTSPSAFFCLPLVLHTFYFRLLSAIVSKLLSHPRLQRGSEGVHMSSVDLCLFQNRQAAHQFTKQSTESLSKTSVRRVPRSEGEQVETDGEQYG
ncbi:hypothetical protein PBY51_015435 [Eleginops maclovinus]|uniref:Uncharacterized protein n=1 Tax=Eleginops maclovinus TaxID=56733 RepID=A0AAN7X0U5_ELEMC|nr:hypothetical protein PBY51_015435 [Eleginops maclovinus]